MLVQALQQSTSHEVADKTKHLDSRISQLKTDIQDNTSRLLEEDEKRDFFLNTKVFAYRLRLGIDWNFQVATVFSHVDHLWQEASAGIEAVAQSTSSELNKTETKLRLDLSRESEALQQSIDSMQANTAAVQGDLAHLAQDVVNNRGIFKDMQGDLAHLAGDVVNNRGALLELKEDESRHHSALEHVMQSRQHTMQNQLQQFKREAMQEVEAIKRSSERRRQQQDRFKSTMLLEP